MWFKIDDKFRSHRKVLSIPRSKRRGALALWVQAGVWCADQLTDGLVPFYMLEELDPNLDNQDMADALVTAQLWEVTPDGWVFHDWLEYNPSKVEVQANQRVTSRARSEAGKKGAAARWGRPLEAAQTTSEDAETDFDAIANGMANAWQTDSNRNGKPMAPEWQTDGPDPTRPDPTRPDPTRPDPNNQEQTPSTPAPRDVVDPDLEALFNQPSPPPPPPPAAPKYPAAFEEFWNVYPRRVGKDAALKAWRNATRRAGPDVLAGAIRYRDDPHRPTDKNYIPHPATWLNAGRWSDEPCSPPMADARPVKQTRTTTILNDAAERIARYEAEEAAQAANIHHQRIGP